MEIGLFARDQNLGVIGVLNYHCVLDEQTQIVCKNAVEQRAESRALKNTDAVGKRGRLFDATQIVSEADTLGVIAKVR